MKLSEYLIESMVKDITILQHLYTKIPQDSFDFRPRENMRTVRELLHYISTTTSSMLTVFATSTDHASDMARLRTLNPPFEEFEVTDFHFILEEEKRIIKDLIGPLSDEELHTRQCFQPWREQVSMLSGILNGPLKYLTAYRMQLFLYLKLLGENVNTANNWAGMDSRPAPKPAESEG